MKVSNGREMRGKAPLLPALSRNQAPGREQGSPSPRRWGIAGKRRLDFSNCSLFLPPTTRLQSFWALARGCCYSFCRHGTENFFKRLQCCRIRANRVHFLRVETHRRDPKSPSTGLDLGSVSTGFRPLMLSYEMVWQSPV